MPQQNNAARHRRTSGVPALRLLFFVHGARLRAAAAALCLALCMTSCAAPAERETSAPHLPAQESAANAGTSSAQTAQQGNPLTVVSMANRGMPRNGADGFYLAQAPYFDEQYYLTYYDYSTLEQRFVCTVPECVHKDTSCGAYLSQDVAPVVFVTNGKLYCGYGGYYRENQTGMLEQRELDGTNPRVLAECPWFDFWWMDVYTDGQALYTTGAEGSAQKILRVDLATGELTATDVEWGENQVWHGGSYGRNILSTRRESQQATATPTTIYAANVDDGTQSALYEFPKEIAPCMAMECQPVDGKMYGVNLETREVMSYDLAADEVSAVTDVFSAYGAPIPNETEMKMEMDTANEEDKAMIMQMQEERKVLYPANYWTAMFVGDWLCVNLEDDLAPLPANGFRRTIRIAGNLKTGETKQIPFTDFWNGYEHTMIIQAVTPQGVLVTQEHRFVKVPAKDTGKLGEFYDATYEVFALIDPDDLLNGKPNFRTIQPVEYKVR